MGDKLNNRPLTDAELLEIVNNDEFWEESNDREGRSDEVRPTAIADDRIDGLKQILNSAEQSDFDEEDNEMFSDHDSDSSVSDDGWSSDDEKPLSAFVKKQTSDIEEDASEDEAQTMNVGEDQLGSKYYYGKNNSYKWAKIPPLRTKTPRHNIITVQRGLQGPSKVSPPKTPLEAWNLLITEDMIEIIVRHTNEKIDILKQRYKQFSVRKNCRKTFLPTFIKNTDAFEIRAFIGLLYLQGLFKSNHEDLRSLWATDGTGRDIFRCAMSLARFSYLLVCLRFDDASTRKDRMKNSKLAAFENIFNKFVEHSKNNYSPGPHCTIDEMLVPFRGRCSFRMYIPNKPAKYGLKVQILADSETHYMVNAEVYTGKEINLEITSKPDKKKISHPTQVVLRLIEPIKNTNRNITADNWYSSLELLEELQKFGFTYVGTLKKNKPQIPPQFLPNRKRPVESSLFGFTAQATIVSYVPKQGKAVILLSTMHHDNKVDEDIKNKPDIILFYNSTKAGVDALDEKCATYSTSRRTRRWPMVLFHACLNIANVNSRVLYMLANQNKKISRYSFIKTLSRQLCEPYLRKRMNMIHVPRKLRSMCAGLLGEVLEDPAIPPQQLAKSKRRRCGICPTAKDRKTNNCCSKCKIPICLKCAAMICPNCI